MKNRAKDEVYEMLRSIVGSGYVSNDDFELWCNSRDGSDEFPNIPSYVVMPRTTEEVSQIVRLANELKIPVWPRGGGTGCDGSGMPLTSGGIVVDMTQMTKILKIDEEQMTATVQAGIVLRTFEQRLKEKGLHPRIQGSVGSGLGASVAGGITAGAAGYGGQQYGNYCDALVSLEVVLPNGDIIRTGSDANPASGKFTRYANGPDIAGLYCLSHGIFGIITEVTMEVIPAPEAFAYATPVFPTIEALVSALRKIGIYELAYSSMGFYGNPTVRQFAPESTAHGILFLLIQGRRKEVDYKKEFLDEIVKDAGGHDLGPQIAKAIYHDDDPHMLMPSLGRNGKMAAACNFMPPWRVPDFVRMEEKFFHEENKEIFEKYNFRGPFIGISGFKGHYMSCPNVVMYDEDRPEAWDAMNSLWKKWNKRIVEWGGAPYHIGLAFGRPLVQRWSGPYYTCIRSIKRALDPNNIMNPGMFGKLSQDFEKE